MGKDKAEKEGRRIGMSDTYQDIGEHPDNAELLRDPKRYAQKENKKSDNPEDQAGASRHGFTGGVP